jgi:hypothetical protein
MTSEKFVFIHFEILCLFFPSTTAFSAFGGILFGYDTGVISGIKEMKSWLRQFGFASTDPKHVTGYAISSSSESLVVSILSAGTFFGALIAAPAAGEYIPHPRTCLNSRNLYL